MKLTARELILKLLDRYELALAENAALKLMLSSLPDELATTWEEILNRQLEDHTFREELRATTSELRAAISAALDREVVSGMLLGFPEDDEKIN